MKIKSDKIKKSAFINGKVYYPLKNKLIPGNVIVENGLLKDLNYNGSLEGFEIIDCKPEACHGL